MVQLLDQTILLKQRNENAWADHPKLRVFPAHQCFRTAEHGVIRPDIKLRLIVDQELLFLNGGSEVLQQLFRIDLGFMQGIIIDRHSLAETVPDRVSRQFGTVKAAFQIIIFV